MHVYCLGACMAVCSGVGVRGGCVAYWGGVFKVTILAFFEWGDFLKKLKE